MHSQEATSFEDEMNTGVGLRDVVVAMEQGGRLEQDSCQWQVLSRDEMGTRLTGPARG